MANWTTPKVDYWDTPRPIGGEDLKRIEGNIAALESGVVIPKGVLIRAVPSDAVILEANTQRSASIAEGTKLVKEFMLKYPGAYRFKCEVRRIGLGSENGSVIVSVSDGSGGSASISSNNWQPRNFEISTGEYGSVVRVSLRARSAIVEIRNVKICGTLTTIEPEYVVLRN